MSNGYEQSQQDNVTLITISSELQSIYGADVPALDDITELARTVDPPNLVIDLSHVDYFGSAFISFLIRVSDAIKTRDAGRFAVSAPTSFGQMALGSTKAGEIFAVHSSTAEALDAMKSGA